MRSRCRVFLFALCGLAFCLAVEGCNRQSVSYPGIPVSGIVEKADDPDFFGRIEFVAQEADESDSTPAEPGYIRSGAYHMNAANGPKKSGGSYRVIIRSRTDPQQEWTLTVDIAPEPPHDKYNFTLDEEHRTK